MNVRTRMLSVIAATALAGTAALAQPGTVPMTPHVDVPLVTTSVVVPAKFQGMNMDGHTLNLPEGWRVNVFYAGTGLNKPRFLTWGPDSVLYVANVTSGRVMALPDKNPRDGVADTAILAADNVFGHDLKFYNGAMYVAEAGKVIRLTDDNGDGYYESRNDIITGIPTGGNHTTRTIVIDSVKGKIYISIGSSCNVCREEDRAIIAEYNIDGSGRRVYASGVRNAVGMTLHPRTGQLWATNNGHDNQGNDIPPEWIDMVRENGFYGWPFAYGYQVYNDFTKAADYQALLPVTPADSARVMTMASPGALVQAHSALMAIEFPNSSAFPEQYRRGAFVVSRGSWNRQPPTGYKVIYLDFDNDQDSVANSVSDFLTGFLTDSAGSSWGRPVGLESDMMGNLYLTSDAETQGIFYITREQSLGVQDAFDASGAISLAGVYPNPVSGVSTLRFSLREPSNVTVTLLDVAGKPAMVLASNRTFEMGEQALTFDTKGLPAGTYFYRVETAQGSVTGSISVVR